MKKYVSVILLYAVLSCCLFSCSPTAAPGQSASPSQAPSPSRQVQTAEPSGTPDPETVLAPEPSSQYSPEEIAVKRDLLVFMTAYSGYIQGLETDKDGFIHVVMKSGASILYDDRKQKTFDEKMSGADLEDSLSIPYPLGDFTLLAHGDNDPGRIRPYTFLKEIYGIKKETIKSNLISANLGSVKARFNKNDSAADALENVFNKLNEMIAANPDIKPSVYPLSGTYCYRRIAGTKLLSVHSFGIAIDLHAGKNPSWRTISRKEGQMRIDSFPPEIVSVFEENGFIWGGKWSHFDIMHFEYRPEIILKAKYNTEITEGESWYAGFPDSQQVKNCVKLIDESI